MQIICKVKKPSVSISSKLNVVLVEAARSKSRPPTVTTAQSASVPALDVHPSTPPPGLNRQGDLLPLFLFILMWVKLWRKKSPPLWGQMQAGLREDGDFESRENWVPQGLGKGSCGHQSTCSRKQASLSFGHVIDTHHPWGSILTT